MHIFGAGLSVFPLGYKFCHHAAAREGTETAGNARAQSTTSGLTCKERPYGCHA